MNWFKWLTCKLGWHRQYFHCSNITLGGSCYCGKKVTSSVVWPKIPYCKSPKGQMFWIVGKNIDPDDERGVWEFIGIFDSKDAAVKACIKSMYFIGPAILNEALPDERQPLWPGAFYPLLEE